MSKRYRPSNGTEGEQFQGAFCYVCLHDKRWRDEQKSPCTILNRALAYDVNEPEYPDEWQYNDQGQPCCTAFEPDTEAEGYVPPPDPAQIDLFTGGDNEQATS